MSEKELLANLRKVFRDEARERMDSISSRLIRVENTEGMEEIQKDIEVIFRDVHSLKGAARAVNYTQIESFFQSMESLISEVKKKNLALNRDVFDLLHTSIKKIGEIICSENPEKEMSLISELAGLKDELNIIVYNIHRKINLDEKNGAKNDAANERNLKQEKYLQPDSSSDVKETENSWLSLTKAQTKPGVEENFIRSDTVRISSAKLDSILIKSENMVQLKQLFAETLPLFQDVLVYLNNIKYHNIKISGDIALLKQISLRFVENDYEGVNSSVFNNLISYFEQNIEFIKNFENRCNKYFSVKKEQQFYVNKIVDALKDDIKEITMLPFSNILSSFPGMTRDISRSLNKNVKLVITGEDTKLDRRILEKMKYPLMHLVRNAIDHGIEESSSREKTGKNPIGSVKLEISQLDISKVEILVSDDGGGIDLELIKEKILNENLIDSNTLNNLSSNQILEFIFSPGFTTKRLISTLSGRGIGLSIVKEAVDSFGGSISIDTQKDKFTNIVIQIPMSISTFKGVILEIADRQFIIPNNSIEEIVRLSADCVKIIEDKLVISYNEKICPIVSLAAIFGFFHDSGKKEFLNMVIIKYKEEFIALEFDSILNEQEIIVKDFGKLLSKIRYFAGGSLLSDGRIAPVLRVSDIFDAAFDLGNVVVKQQAGEKSEEGEKSILVVDDSITARVLLRNIVETAGYKAITAVDGEDALNQLKKGNFGLVVADVEMPKLDGFCLAAKIRSDEKLENLPIILVTARESKEDKEKGIECGANAYIVKNRFDQANLIEIIKSLLE